MKLDNLRVWRYVLSTCLLLILGTGFVFSQTRGFSKNPDIFIGELGDHVKKLKDKDVEKTYEAFQAQWETGVYTEDQEGIRSSDLPNTWR